METFNTDPKPGRLILPLVLIGMIATTYTFINRVATNNSIELVSDDTTTTVVETAEAEETTTTSTTTTLPEGVVNYLEEITGEKIVKENDIPSDVKITESVPVGRYGVRFNFTDPSPGAGAGIYTFSFLRKLGEDAAQNSSFDA